MARKMRPWMQNVVVLVIAAMFLLFILEGAIRLLAPQPCSTSPEGLYAADDALCYAFSPHAAVTIAQPEFTMHIATNAEGLRDHEISEKKNGTFRILAVGDSIQLGSEVPLQKLYVKRLEQELGNVEIINAAVGGYNTYQELALAQRLIKQYAPDMILLSFYLGNDFSDNLRMDSCTMTVRDGRLVSAKAAAERTILFDAKVFLNSNSQLYCFGKNRAVNLPWIGRALHDDTSFLSVLAFAKIPLSEDAAAAVNATDGALSAMAAMAEAQSIKIAIVAIPSKLQVSPLLWESVASGNDDAARPSALVQALAEQHNITFIDTYPLLRGSGGLYFRRDIHLTEEGHAAVAAAVLPALAGIIDTRP